MSPIRLVVPLVALLASAQDRPRLHPQPAASRDTATGPAVGTRIPKFALLDQDGKVQTLDSLRGPKGLVLVFTRSADWCPYCKTQMVDLNHQTEAFRKRGLGVASITYDSTAILKDFGNRQTIVYPMLSDPDSKIIRAFGIFNANIERDNRAYGVPFPGTYIVDEHGIVKSKYFEDDYTERYSAASILTREFGADGVQQTTIETPHLKLTSSASDAAFAPGRRITLILEADLGPGLHVYAPGVEHGYIPIEWAIKESKAWILFPAEYPKARTMEFSALKEVVPVYDGHFRLLRDVTIGSETEIASALSSEHTLTVEGSFRYQACNDKECFTPRTLPIQWTFRIGELDRQRVPEAIHHK
jgi:peroxiredoxin